MDPFAALKDQITAQYPSLAGYRRIWLHLFDDQDTLARWVGKNQQGKSEDFDDPWEPGAYTDDHDDVYTGEYPRWRNALGIGTLKVAWHELRHIWLNGADEDGVRNDNDEHHKFLKCSSWGLCVGADHGVRFIDTHTGGVPKQLAVELLDRARAAQRDVSGIRHAYVDVREDEILALNE